MRRFYLICSATVLLVLALVLFLGLRSGEPVYGGKPLSYWLNRLDMDSSDRQAVHALLAMGTNCLPFLAARIAGQDSSTKAFLFRTVGDDWLARLGFHPARETAALGISGFGALGSNAAPAIPALVVSLTNPQTAFRAAMALDEIGPAGLCALTNAATPPSTAVKMAFLFGVYSQDSLFLRMGPGRECIWIGSESQSNLVASVHLPYLLALLRDPDAGVRAFAAGLLGGLRARPAVVVPALEKLLTDPELAPRSAAAQSLAQFGREATAAVPALVEHIKQAKGASERESTIQALKEIDPASAARFPRAPH